MSKALLAAAVAAATACNRIPEGVRPLVDQYQPQAQKLAEDLAPLCAAGYEGGRQYWSSFPTAAAPGLAADPQVVQIVVTCMWPVENGGFGGNYVHLREPIVLHRTGSSAFADFKWKDDWHEDNLSVPSSWTETPTSVDIEVLRPVPEDSARQVPKGRVRVTVAVRRG